jgi:hypothetical protein
MNTERQENLLRERIAFLKAELEVTPDPKDRSLLYKELTALWNTIAALVCDKRRWLARFAPEPKCTKATRNRPVYDDRPMPSRSGRSGSSRGSSGGREAEYGGNNFGWGHEYG